MGVSATPPKSIDSIPTPAYVADEKRLRRNLNLLADVKNRTGTQILYAIKACPLYPLFPIIAESLDGSTASGLFEARLGCEEFGKAVHVFCPAYLEAEIDALLGLGQSIHFYFNSIDQINRFMPTIRSADAGHRIGLRVNPRLSVAQHEQYNPCRRGSHLGVPLEKLHAVPWDAVDVFHVHALCENLAQDSARLIDQVAQEAGHCLEHVSQVNFGGGHFITHPDFDIDTLVAALNTFKARYPHLDTVLEPGAAVVRDAGYLVTSVIDIVDVDGIQTAIVDASANCHVPDVMKAGIRLDILGAGAAGEKAYTYTIAGRTCMARDLWGTYSFDTALKANDRIIFSDALQYSLGEANWFNGHPRPDLGIIGLDGNYTRLAELGYDQFKSNCG